MRATTCSGSSLDTQISVFSGICGQLQCVAGNDNACGQQSLAIWQTTAGADYYVLVHDKGGDTGSFSLEISGSAATGQVSNDICELAEGPLALGSTVPVALAGATVDPGASVCLGTWNGFSRKGLWYTVIGTGGFIKTTLTVYGEPLGGWDYWVGDGNERAPTVFVYSLGVDGCEDLGFSFCVPFDTVRSTSFQSEFDRVYYIFVHVQESDVVKATDITLSSIVRVCMS